MVKQLSVQAPQQERRRAKRDRPASAAQSANMPDPQPVRHSKHLEVAREIARAVFGAPHERWFNLRYWDGTTERPSNTLQCDVTIAINRPGALRRMLLPPSEMGMVEAYLSNDVDVLGDIESVMNMSDVIARRIGSPAKYARLVPLLLALPAEDVHDQANEGRALRFSGRTRISRRRGGAAQIQHHYDVGNDFYSLWLDRRMVYTCAYYARSEYDLDTAQVAKLEHICRKLRLKAGMTLLDIGCGWGALIMHAAEHHGVEAMGITLSKAQAELAQERIRAAGLEDRCRVELRDYRDMPAGVQFDRIASVGMMEHVGRNGVPTYFAKAFQLLKPGGVFLNHCIVRVAHAERMTVRERVAARLWRRDEFMDKYVFPDGEITTVGRMLEAAELAGLETRDVEGLREHYRLTAREWLSRLEARQDEAVRLVGEQTYRVWRLFLFGAAYGFRAGRLNLVQATLVKPHANGTSGMPLTRDYLYARHLFTS